MVSATRKVAVETPVILIVRVAFFFYPITSSELKTATL